MPFLPFVLLLAWQALSKSASFALGWATAIYFGQVPGRQGRVLSVISLVAAGWVIVVVGFGIPSFGGAALEAAGVIEENFDVEALTYVGLVAAIVLTPPLIVAATVHSQFHEDRSVGTWLLMIPVSNLYLTWNEEAQGFEDDLQRIHESKEGDVDAVRAELDEVQARIDVASLNLEEWNVVYRLRLQLEQAVARRGSRKS